MNMKISVYMAVSTNGFISNRRNVPDWLSPEYGQGFVSVCQKFKAVIMGKTTYDIIAPDHLPLQQEGTTVVLTTDQQAKSDNPTVVFTKNTAAEIAEMLSQKGHTEAVIIGGSKTISEFVESGLVDDFYLVVEPVLFGSGLPLVNPMEIELKLRLLEMSKLNENTVQLHYGVQK
jgi:dihydrofolate reductase